jgi:hypothetical protein
MTLLDSHEQMIQVLRGHGVQFVVIGGCAIQIHGWAGQTEDLDVTPQRAPRNLRRLVDALHELDAELIDVELDDEFAPQDTIDARFLRNLTSAAFETSLGRLDVVMAPDGTHAYDGLRVNAHRVRVGSVTAHFASLDDVIESKRAADRIKDRAVIPQLEQLREHHRGKQRRRD